MFVGQPEQSVLVVVDCCREKLSLAEGASIISSGNTACMQPPPLGCLGVLLFFRDVPHGFSGASEDGDDTAILSMQIEDRWALG